MPHCVYCGSDKNSTGFTREHVVHAGFGAFEGALTLPTAVCAECNQAFGDTIDRELLRESAEGLERYRWGGKDPSEIERFQYSHLSLHAKVPGDFAGARFELKAGEGPGGLVARLVPTIGFARKDGSGFVDYTEQQVIAREWESNPDIDWRKGVRALGEGKETIDRLLALMEAQGIKPTKFREFGPSFARGEEITVQQRFDVTTGMERAIAKIAFNYLVYREGADFVRSEAFDPIRRFIRYGELLSLPPIHTSPDLPFGVRNLPATDQRPVLHFVGICAKHRSHENLLGVVCLFGFMTHTVMLAETYSGRWPAQHAHLYNPKTRAVHPWKPGAPPSLTHTRPRRSK